MAQLKTIICNFCARTGVLCKECNSKLRKGKINELDIEISKVFVELDQKYAKQLNDVIIRAVQKTNDNYIILARNGSKINSNTEIIDLLERKLTSNIIIIEEKKNIKSTFAELFNPLKIDRIDQLYVPPEGDLELRIQLKGDIEKLGMTQAQLQQVASVIAKTPVRIEVSSLED